MKKRNKIILIVLLIIALMVFANWFTYNVIFNRYDKYRDNQRVCDYNAYNCDDFNTHAEAQVVFDYCKSQGKGDIHHLDGDDDGLACETLPQ